MALLEGQTLKAADIGDNKLVTSLSGVLSTVSFPLNTYLKSPDGNYWKASIDNAGSVTWTNVGTTAPTVASEVA